MRWLRNLILSSFGLLVGGVALSQVIIVPGGDPTITIKTAVATNRQSILGTFTVTNPGKKELVRVQFLALQKAGGHLHAKAAKIKGDDIPDIEVPVSGELTYDCLAILEFKDGTTNASVASKLALNRLAKGAQDKANYGILTNAPSVSGTDVEVATTYTAGAKWNAKANKNARTWLVPVNGGRFSVEESTEVTKGKSWFKKREGVAKGDYNLLGFLLIENSDTKADAQISARGVGVKVK